MRKHVLEALLVGLFAASLWSCGGGTQCGAGTTKVDGRCVPLGGGPLTLCGSGTELDVNTNRCVPSNSVCGAGTQLNTNGDACVLSNTVCGPGTQPDGTGRCILASGLCGPGTQQNAQTCEPLCDTTEIFDGTNCVPGSTTSCGMFTAEDSSGMCVPAARVQVAHNSADPALATVDVYANGTLLVDDMDFRTATTFVDVVAGDVTIDIAASDSVDNSSPLYTEMLSVTAGTRYFVVASGVGAGAFTPTGTVTTPNVDLVVFTGAEETFDSTTEVRFNVYNGVIDGDDVTLGMTGGAYGTFSGYGNMAAGTATLEAVDSTGPTRVDSFQTSIRGVANAPGGLAAGTVGVLMASGFVDPSGNMNGEAYEAVAVFPDGSTGLLDRAGRLQVVHAAADPGLSSVDVYVDGALSGDLTALTYESATAFLTVPSDSDLAVDIVANGDPIGMSLTSGTTLRLDPGTTAVAIASGVETPGDFDPNPGAIGTALAVNVISDALEEAADPSTTSLVFFHAVTDASPVDINPGFGPSIPALEDDLFYAEVSSYQSIAAGKIAVDVTVTGASPTRLGVQTSVTSEPALMDGLPAGQAGVVLASGFFDSQQGSTMVMNRNITLSLVTPDGDVFPLDQAARLQVIHNAADPALATVDIDVGSAISFVGVAFREATPFGTVPSGGFDLEVLNGSGGTVFMGAVNLSPGSTNQAVAVGVESTTGFDTATNGTIDFDVALNTAAREVGTSASMVDYNFMHGVSDVGTLTNVSVGGGSIGTSVAYESVTGFGQQVEAVYEVNLDDGMGDTCWSLDLTGQQGEVLTLLYSGFDTPGDDNNGPALQLMDVRPDGAVTMLASTGCM